MKNLIPIILLFLVSNIYSQEDLVFKTDYKYKPNGKIAIENYEFSFLPNQGKLIRKDLDLGFTKTYWIKFYDTSYSKDGKYFIVTYGTDYEKHMAIEKNDRDLNAFTIVYDKKMGNILLFSIDSLSDGVSSFYLTKLGKEVKAREKN